MSSDHPSVRLVGLLLGILLLIASASPAGAHVNDKNAPFRAMLAFDPAVPVVGEPVRMRVDVRHRDGRPAAGVTVSAELFRGISRTVVPFRPEAPGVYSAERPFGSGLWQGVVKVESGGLTMFGDLSFRPAEAGAGSGTRIAGVRLDLREGGAFTAAPWLDYVAWVGVLAVLLAGSFAFALRSRRRPAEGVEWSGARGLNGAVPGWVRNVALAGTLLGPAGAFWDVSWHVDRGRETFWSPPHLLIYGSLVATAVVLGSAPLDELWHGLFGLDASIWAPPHLALLFGMGLAVLGLTLLEPPGAASWRRVLLVAAAQLIMFIFVLEFEYRGMEEWHVLQGRPAALYPLWSVVLAVLTMAFASRLENRPWAATTVAGLAWILRAGVSIVYLPTLGLTAPALPPPIFVAAIAFDVARARFADRGATGFALAGGGATAVSFALHGATQSLWSATQVAPGELLAWAPLAVVASAAAGQMGFHLGRLDGERSAEPLPILALRSD